MNEKIHSSRPTRRPIVVALCGLRNTALLLATGAPLGCTSESDAPSGDFGDECQDVGCTGGSLAGGTGGGDVATGGTGGAMVTTGGTGGADTATGGSGGADTATGGANMATGGTGGEPMAGGSGGADSATGGVSGTGGTSTGGMGNFEPPFVLGADISMTQGQASFTDTDGQSKSMFDLLKNHGFNYVRLKTFVDPTAVDWNGCTGSTAGSKENVIDYGAQAKAAGMGFLLDFHYSDIWADPGNQIIPRAWRGASTEEELAEFVEEYTFDVISSAIVGGARPDMVQIGNEITHGMLYDVPGPNTDCWGNDPVDAPLAIAGWEDQPHFIPYLKAGIAGVRRADPSIEIVLHTERPNEAVTWLGGVVDGGVDVDIFGLSCYESYQGGYTACRSAFEALIADSRFDDIDFVVAEYNPQRTEMNLMMRDLADGRGRGTFFWEPTASGDWGTSMFNGSVAIPSAFEEYDDMLAELGLEAW